METPEVGKVGTTPALALDEAAALVRGARQIARRHPVDAAAVMLVSTPHVSTTEGEWEAWYLAPWLPGANRYKSFWDLAMDELRMRYAHDLDISTQTIYTLARPGRRLAGMRSPSRPGVAYLKRYARIAEPERLVRVPKYRPTLADPFHEKTVQSPS
ncbi:hypothetical protein [Nonomuraea sp. NPDC023979]|uniref:hypothetical protein n=1 Tax=Nonomuraea sp. NPDC023979 TaxID=3154796 RepID=UPI003403820B